MGIWEVVTEKYPSGSRLANLEYTEEMGEKKGVETGVGMYNK